MFRLFIIILLLGSLLHAKSSYPTLTRSDGTTVIAKPIGVDGEKIIFLKQNGKHVTSPLNFFSDVEQKKLSAWKKAVEEDNHHKVVRKIKATEQAKILFIGNSYSFKVPKALRKIATEKGKKVTIEQITKGGWTLKKHAEAAKHIAKISHGNYDVVILQEQSLIPSFPESQRAKMMDPAAHQLVTAIRKSGAEPVFFQTWGRRDGDKQNAAVFPNDTYEAMQTRLNQGYANTANSCGGVHVIPIGTLWGEIMKHDKKRALTLYTKDGSHPSKAGVEFAAAIIYSALYDETSDEKISQSARLRVIVYPIQ